MRARYKLVRESETPAQRTARLEKRRQFYNRKKNIQMNKEDVVAAQTAVVMKKEPVEFVPETVLSQDKDVENVKQDNGDAVPVQPAVYIKEEPREFYPQPFASADVVIKEEFVVSKKDYTGSSAIVPPSTEPTSHVTLSVAGLTSNQQPDNLLVNFRRKKEDVVPIDPPVVIKEEHDEFVPEPFPSEDKDIKNVKKDNADAVPVQPVVFIKQEPIEFDHPQPSTSTDIVIKD
ncbi:hypothetical protein CDAR_470801 [Caerostris darwini]|uniref:Uncharacterized protein n=1 Tax=Caerostris darwini TaxID=1538125 RepID=A0AAV4VH06_9ARAC|nr:hypothetical protein CDAR_470801 [Caerostris darwini]